MVFEKMLTIAICAIISRIVICVFVQIFVRAVNICIDHLNRKIVLTDLI